MIMNKWVKIAVTVGVVLLSAVVGMQFGLMMEDGNILGEMAWNVNLPEVTGIVFAIAAASSCMIYFNEDKK